jgi:protoporphyrinogen oxidase
MTILQASRVKDWRRLEAIPVDEWLTRWSGKRTFERIWLPLLRAKLGENWRKASAAFIWAIIARMYAARRTGLKREMFGYVPGGYARILETFATVLAEKGVRLECGRPARRVRAAGGGLAVEFSSGIRETFDQVIVTAAAPVAADLCEGLTADEDARLRGIQYQGVICASLLLDEPLAGYYVTNIVEPWVPFTAVIEMSALVDRKQFGGRALIYLPKYVASGDPLFGTPDDALQETFLTALERMYPGFRRRQVRAFQVSRVKHVLAISTVNYSDRLPPMTMSVPGLHIVNNAHIVNGTLNVNDTIRLADRATERLLSSASATPIQSHPPA